MRLEKCGTEWRDAKPILTASILLPDGTVTNGYLEGYTLTQKHEGGSYSSGFFSELKWYRTDLKSGAYINTLANSNLTSDAITVMIRDNIATPSNIVFRMKAKIPAKSVQENAHEPAPSIIRQLLL